MKRVGVVGWGRFGRALGDLVLQRGGEVRAFDPFMRATDAFAGRGRERATSIDDLVATCDVVVVATPIDVMAEVFDSLRAAIDARPGEPSPLVMDVGSVKVVPVRALSRSFPAESGVRAVGTHPLFGPSSLARAERPLSVVVCPEPHNSEATVDAAESFWRELGCQTLRVDPETHDRVMARTHAIAFFFAKGIVDAGFAEDPPPFSPPSYQAMAKSVEAVRADAGHLFRSIEVDNPFARAARAEILRALMSTDEDLNEAGAAERSPLGGPPPASALVSTAFSALPTAGLEETRALIDDLDRELVALLARRAELAERAAHAKSALGLATRDPAREAALLAARREWATASGLDADAIGAIFDSILRFSRAHQRR